MTDHSSPRWQRKKDARPAEILDAALTLFVEKGFRATKMEDIARAANVTKGTPYLYFQNKEEIFKAVVRDTLVPRLTNLQAMSAQHEGSSTELLVRLLQAWWQDIGSTRMAGLCKLMMAEAANFPELAAFYQQEVIVRGRQLVADTLRLGIERGEFRPVDIDSAVECLIAPLLMTVIWNQSFGGIPSCAPAPAGPPEHYLQLALDLMLNGLCAPAKNNN